MAEVGVHVKLPIPPDGFVKVTLKIADVRTVGEADQGFILALMDKLAAFAGPGAQAAVTEPVIRGLRSPALRPPGGRA